MSRRSLLRQFNRSKQIFEDACRFITGGVHSGFRFMEPHPLYYKKAKGSRVWDIDGNEYIDCIINNGALILGHGDERVIEAVRDQLETGLTCTLESEMSVEVARMLHRMIPSAEIVKFSTTGTEAVMHALMIARGYSQKEKIIKVEGGYNGWYDYALVSSKPPLEKAGSPEEPVAIPDSQGLPSEVERKVIIMPFNNIEAAKKIVEKNKDEAAAVIMEPVMFNLGCVVPKPSYLEAVRELTQDNGIILIFDEVISGFRMAPGGAQEYYGVTPDISVFGKAIASGFPLSAVVGKKKFMEVTTPKTGRVAYAGTYNANQTALAVAKATLEVVRKGEIQRRLHDASKRLEEGFNEAAEKIGLEAHIQAIGGKFQTYFTSQKVVDYRTAATSDKMRYAAFWRKMLDSGVLMHPSPTFHHGVCAAHTDEDLAYVLHVMEDALRDLRAP